MSLAAACGRPSKPPNPSCCDTSSTIDAAAHSCCHDGDAGHADALASAPPRESASAEVSAAVAEERFVPSEGCARELRIKGPIERSVAELGRLCAQGMTPVGDAARASEPQGGAVETSFSVGARPMCFRVGAIASAGALSLTLAGPRGEPLASARSNDPLDLLPSEGPVCVREPGTYRAAARLVAGAPDGADVILQVWHSGREP